MPQHQFTNKQEEQLRKSFAQFTGNDAISITEAGLEKFIRDTEGLRIPAEERLRQLAIDLETEDFANGWQDLRLIYQAAARINPKDADIFHSWGVSATGWYEIWRTPDKQERLAIAAEGEKALSQAREIEPLNPDIAYTTGMLFYSHPANDDEPATYLHKAKDWFLQALKHDAGHIMAQLYLAHCYHDLAHNLDAAYWPLALKAYEEIDQKRLAAAEPAWYAVKCREQIAVCHIWCGNETEARHFCAAFLEEIEGYEVEAGIPHEAVTDFDEIVEALTQKMPEPEILSRLREQVKRYGFEDLYPKLFLTQS
jgi:hypothetical protein